jgi:hypothetical protein
MHLQTLIDDDTFALSVLRCAGLTVLIIPVYEAVRRYSTPSSRSSLATVTVVLPYRGTCAGIFAPALAGMLRPIH